MKSQTEAPYGQAPYGGAPQTTTATVHTGKPPMSIWWPMGVLAGWVLCFIAAAGLIGAYESSANCEFNEDDGTTTCYGNNGEFYAGIAFIIVAVILKFIFWGLLIVRCYQRRRGYVSVTTVVENNNLGNQQGVPLNQYVPQQEQHTGYQSQVYQDVPLQTRYS